MRSILTSGDLKDIIAEQHYPDGFHVDQGLHKRSYEIDYHGIRVGSKEIYFDGILIGFGDYHTTHDLTLRGKYDRPLLSLSFGLKGEFYGKTDGTFSSTTFGLSEGEALFCYIPEPSGVFDFKANTELTTFSITFTESYFKRFSTCQSPVYDEILNSIIRERPHIKLTSLPACGRIREIIYQVQNSRLEGPMQRFMLEAKIIELFCLWIDACDSINPNSHKSQHADSDRIYYARELLYNSMHDPPSISELARLCGINEFKLKKGFKEIFHNTVMGTLFDYKMKLASELLLQSDLTIGEISDMTGYVHQQHFSTAFKRKFGVAPTEWKHYAKTTSLST